MENSRKKVLKAVLAAAFFLAAVLPLCAEGLDFSITEWNTGALAADVVEQQKVDIVNNTDSRVHIDLISTCSCMTTEPESLDLEPGGNGSFDILFDSSDDDGEFEKLLIIQTDSDAMPKGFFVVTGSVERGGGSDADTADAETGDMHGAEGGEVPLYYYTPGCKSCNKFLEAAVIEIDRRDITEAEYYEELQSLLEERGTALKAVPVFVTADKVYQGEEKVKEGYTALVEGKDISGKGEDGSSGRTAGITIAVLPVILAGLLDGVNPCAFTTLIFLLSALSVAGRSRRETLVIGLFFTVTVFVTYYLIGLGFFRIIRIADSFSLVSRAIRWVLFGVLLLFSGLSIYDYVKIKRGRATEILLQLPDGVKRRMHSSIRSYSKSAALAGSSIVMGFLISVFELGCTGQIYFPTITYIIQTGSSAEGYGFLALYNLAFILPLAAVFVVVYFGTTSKKVTRLFQSNLAVIKLLTALLFIGFAVLMLVL